MSVGWNPEYLQALRFKGVKARVENPDGTVQLRADDLVALIDSLNLTAQHHAKSALPVELCGDGPCSRCDTSQNIVWFTDNVFWNNVIRTEPSPYVNNEPILCVNCFVSVADAMGFNPTSWRLLPEWPWRRR